ncbi:LppU/SCO3897 family protein, partial [Streptomyces albicerus]|uniref:LppU/SCO3897 family protein n=1 Tax=Streptomyces albicerus TaxID=2569859 RepID=UPI00124BC6A7
MTTPPPQGQNPFAQGQPPQGNPYGQQPPQGHPQQPAAPYTPVPPQQPKRGFKKYLRVGIVVIALIVAGAGYLASRDDAQAAKVGDCMSIGNPDSATDPELEVVDCSNSKAAYKVEDKKSDDSGCDRTKYAEYTETGGGSDFTLCLSEYS